MTTADIIRAFPATPEKDLIEEINEALDQVQRSHLDWVEGSLKLAGIFFRVRDKYDSDNAFGKWFKENKSKFRNGDRILNDHDRSALVGLGSDLTLAREVLEKETRTSYQHIWREVKGRFPVRRSCHLTRPKVDRQKPEKPKHNNPPQPRGWNERHPFFKLKRGEEINAAFVNKNAAWGINVVMTELGKTGAAELWNMLVQCYDAGFIGESRYYPNGDHDPCSLRLLFPRVPISYAKQFRMTNDRQRKYVRDTIIPAALANRDDVIADQENLEAIVAKFNGIHLDEKPVEAPKEVAAAAPPQPVPVVMIPVPQQRGGPHPRYLSPQEVDPEFTGTPTEFIQEYGRVQTKTAEQYLTDKFEAWAAAIKTANRNWRTMPELPEVRSLSWLRSPKPSDVAKMQEYLPFLEAQIATARAMLDVAMAAADSQSGREGRR